MIEQSNDSTVHTWRTLLVFICSIIVFLKKSLWLTPVSSSFENFSLSIHYFIAIRFWRKSLELNCLSKYWPKALIAMKTSFSLNFSKAWTIFSSSSKSQISSLPVIWAIKLSSFKFSSQHYKVSSTGTNSLKDNWWSINLTLRNWVIS